MPNDKTLKTELTFPFRIKENDISSLILEQKEWSSEPTFLSFNQIIELNGWSILNDYDKIAEAYLGQCLINDDASFDTTVYVMTDNPDYELVTSNGTFSDTVTTEEVIKEDSILIALDSSVKFGYKVLSANSYEWEGTVYTKSGETIADLPVITFSREDNTLTWEGDVYGTIRYSITVLAYGHALNVPVIVGATENIYATNVLAFQNDKVTTLKITPPETNIACKDLAVDIITGTDPIITPIEEIESEPALVLFNFFDYCTGEIVVATSIQIDGGAVITDFTIPQILTPGEHTVKIIANGYLNSDEDDLANDTFTITV